MTQELVRTTRPGLPAQIADRLPPMIASDERAAWRFVDFFAVTIRNPNTREAYYRAVCRFMDWCEGRGLRGLGDVLPIHVAAYVEQLPLSRASVKQHLSAISRCFDWLVSGGTLESNPATSVQRPKHVVRVGKTPVLSDEEARMLLGSIPVHRVSGLRDRALIGAMLYTFGRVGAVIAMDVEDYRLSNHQRMFLLHEKGGKEHQVPAHHRLIEYLGEYMDATGLWQTPKAPLFQALDITRSRLKGKRMNRQIALQMVRRRARAAGLPPTVNCHSFRATGITNYLTQRRVIGGRSRHCRARVLSDDEAVRPHRGQDHLGRDREDQVLKGTAPTQIGGGDVRSQRPWLSVAMARRQANSSRKPRRTECSLARDSGIHTSAVRCPRRNAVVG